MDKADQWILAVQTNKIDRLLQLMLNNGGFLPLSGASGYAAIVAQAVVGRRGDLEEDENFKQIIPYLVLFNAEGEILYYVRSNKHGDPRLLGQASVGIGGHVEVVDRNNAGETIENAMRREFVQELGDKLLLKDLRVRGLIYREVTAVDRVHIGVLFTATVDSGQLEPDPKEIQFAKFVSRDDLTKLMTQADLRFETWSEVVIKEI